MSFPGKEQIRNNIGEWGEANKEYIADRVKGQAKNWRELPNELNKPEVLEEKQKMFDLAFSLEKEIKEKDYPKDLNERHKKMGDKYKILYERMPSLYYIAIMEELENPKYSDILQVFIKNRENPELIRKGLENIESKEVNQSLFNFAMKHAKTNDPDVKEFIKSFDPSKVPNSDHTGFEKDPISKIEPEPELEEETIDLNQSNNSKSRSRDDLIKKYSKK